MSNRDGVIGVSPVVRVIPALDEDAGSLSQTARETAESIHVAVTGPLGMADLAPLVAATKDSQTAIYENPNSDDVERIVSALENKKFCEGEETIIDHESDQVSFPVPDSSRLGTGERRVLDRCGWVDPESITDYQKGVGFLSQNVDIEKTVETLSEIGLLGRGRGDGGTDKDVSVLWESARETTEDSVVIINATESDPHSYADRLLQEADPYAIIDAALVVARIVDATEVIIAGNECQERACRRMKLAADTVTEILDPSPSLQIVAVADEYRLTEETMTIEALEGAERIEARRRPPAPETYGIYGRPTVIHTPRTLAQLRVVLANPGVFDSSNADPGTRVITLIQDGVEPTVVELSTTQTLEAALDATNLDEHPEFKMACVGGQFGGLTRDLEISANAPALAAAGLGTNGTVELLTDSQCAVAFAGQRAKFARNENCGRCVPCREGSKQLVSLLRDIYDGEYDGGMVRELARTIRDSSLCSFGTESARPVLTAMNEFESEFIAHAEGNCPAGECTNL